MSEYEASVEDGRQAAELKLGATEWLRSVQKLEQEQEQDQRRIRALNHQVRRLRETTEARRRDHVQPREAREGCQRAEAAKSTFSWQVRAAATPQSAAAAAAAAQAAPEVF
ncbi:hypothetical protein Emag_004805 [Eimeria magna]